MEPISPLSSVLEHFLCSQFYLSLHFRSDYLDNCQCHLKDTPSFILLSLVYKKLKITWSLQITSSENLAQIKPKTAKEIIMGLLRYVEHTSTLYQAKKLKLELVFSGVNSTRNHIRF